MSIKVLFWNIENFRGDNAARTAAAAAHIQAFDPDIVGFCEIGSKLAIRNLMFDALSDYEFGITDGAQTIELMAGWKRGVFEQALYTQRREFKAGRDGLRPGAMLSVKKDGTFYNLLFLHTDSGRGQYDYENRREMFTKIHSLRRTLNDIEGGYAKFIVLGDLNTMGRDDAPGLPEITADDEITDLSRYMDRQGMTLHDKSEPTTFRQFYADGRLEYDSDLDHAITSDVVTLKPLVGTATVRVRGWNELSGQDQIDWTRTISDHASLEIEIETP